MGYVPTPRSYLCVTDAARNATQQDRYTKKIHRGLTNFMINEPRNRPTAKPPCAPASSFAPLALPAPGQVSRT